MGCPYLEAMEESDAKELLFSSGEARLRLLHWFTGRYMYMYSSYTVYIKFVYKLFLILQNNIALLTFIHVIVLVMHLVPIIF